jgi:hypothetical protein
VLLFLALPIGGGINEYNHYLIDSKMKVLAMKKILAVSLLALAGTGAMAQSAFEGFYGQVGAGYENNSVASSSFNFGGADVSTPSGSKDAAQINLGLGYNAAVTKEFLLGVGVEYSAISSTFESGELTSVVGCGGACGATQKYTASNRTSIFLTPGYAIAKDKLAYVKAGYSMQTLKSELNQASPGVNQGANFGSKSVGGYVVGLGYKQMISGGFYGFGEADYYSYSSVGLNNTFPSGALVTNNNLTPSAYNFLIGVGYKF